MSFVRWHAGVKRARERAIKKIAEIPLSMIEEHDELKIILGAKPSYAPGVIGQSGSSRGGCTVEELHLSTEDRRLVISNQARKAAGITVWWLQYYDQSKV
jgi:hypothetical protein